MENRFAKDNSLHEHRGDRSEGMAPEPRPANFDLHAGMPLVICGREEDPALEDRESRLRPRCSHHAAGEYAATEACLPASGTRHEPGSSVRISFTPWFSVNARGSVKSNKVGIVDLGEIS